MQCKNPVKFYIHAVETSQRASTGTRNVYFCEINVSKRPNPISLLPFLWQTEQQHMGGTEPSNPELVTGIWGGFTSSKKWSVQTLQLHQQIQKRAPASVGSGRTSWRKFLPNAVFYRQLKLTVSKFYFRILFQISSVDAAFESFPDFVQSLIPLQMKIFRILQCHHKSAALGVSCMWARHRNVTREG